MIHVRKVDWKRRMAAALLALAPALMLGCGGQQPGQPVDVQGLVSGPDGKPAPRIVLKFQPLDEALQQSKIPVAVTEKDGKFAVSCLPGRYRVTATGLPTHAGGPPSTGPGGTPGAPPDSVPQGGPWEVRVKDAGNEPILLMIRGFGPSGKK